MDEVRTQPQTYKKMGKKHYAFAAHQDFFTSGPTNEQDKRLTTCCPLIGSSGFAEGRTTP